MADQLMDFPRTAEVLQNLANDVRAGYIDQLKKNGHYTTRGSDRRLIDSVETVVSVNGHSFTVSLKLNDYWIFVEEDTKPHWPPPDAIRRWVEIKPLLRPDANGKIPRPETLAFLIGRAIAGKSPNQANLKNPYGGTTGTHDLQKTKDAVIPVYIPKIEEALAADISQYIATVFLWK